MKFTVIYADPAWRFDTVKTGGSFTSGAEQVYTATGNNQGRTTMALQEIKALPVPALAALDSVLFLWVPTALKFSHGGPVLHSWGFEYITTVYWEKERLGMGHWFRNVEEELLVAGRGQTPIVPILNGRERGDQAIVPAPAGAEITKGGTILLDTMEELLVAKRRGGYVEPFKCQLRNHLRAPAGEHSAKPEAFRQLIEHATGKMLRRQNLELFARRQVPGWTCLGNEIDGKDLRRSMVELITQGGVSNG